MKGMAGARHYARARSRKFVRKGPDSGSLVSRNAHPMDGDQGSRTGKNGFVMTTKVSGCFREAGLSLKFRP